MSAPVDRVQSAVEQVLAHLRGIEPTGDAPGALDPAQLASLSAEFVAAGTVAVSRVLQPERWIEASLSLEPLEPSWVSLMLGELPAQLISWVEQERVRCMYFMNKPPGLRLRLLGVVDELMPQLRTALEEQVSRGVVARFDVGPYDDEVAQFGGPVGMALAHEFFTRESMLVLEHHRLRLTEEVGLPALDLSLVALDMLLRLVTDDDWELWDVWTKLSMTGRLPAKLSLEPDDPEVARALALRPRVMSLLRDEGRALACAGPRQALALRRYGEGLPALAEALRRARCEGELAWGLRDILPFWIIFHWNRMGFDLLRQQQLALLMAVVLNPKL
ncbi:MAG: thiopeptide-type bacteriocin biosynthesis protein [Nannocystaceae bacterium]